MQCSRCQHENPANAKCCEECASSLLRACSNCGTQLRPNAKFCPQCAHAVDATPDSGQETRGSPTSYTPKYLADKILTSRNALEGERKLVTVLFADLTGSMELLADRDPEEARAILDPVLGHMMDAVHAYEGTVNQVMGDGIMALFGAPIAQEDHAVRACYAAKRMQERISSYGDEVQRKFGVPIQIRVGLHSGEVVVRSIGSDLKMDYSAIGQTTHLAARMEQTAKPGTVLATAAMVALAEGFIQVNPLGPVAVKGMSELVDVFELTGAFARRTRLQARAASGGLSQFVGRKHEFEVLAKATNFARQGKGQAVAVVGEPGVGKSRLYWEFAHSHHTNGCLVVEASSVSYGKATSFLPVIDLLKSYFQIGDSDDARRVREKLTGKLLTLDRTLESDLPPLLALLDQPVTDEQWQQFGPPLRRRRTLAALKRLWLREAQNQPLVLMFEDLHWIDGETQALLNELLDGIPAAQILLLFNYRPEYRSPWGNKTFFNQLRLDTLPVESTQELLTSLLGSEPALEPLKQMLVKRGNPFFLEESVRTLLETGNLVGERGAYKLARPIEALQIPASVQTILTARIDRLDSEDKRLLQTAAAIGKDVPFELLKAVAEIDESDINQVLVRLQSAEFVYEAGLYPDVEYTFKHALTHEVAYGGLTKERRCKLHARIANAIEQIYGERIDEHMERLAHHSLRGEVWDKAVDFSRQAGARAFARSANAEAVRWWEQALEATEHLPDGKDKTGKQIDIRLELRGPLITLGNTTKCLELARQAESIAEDANDRYRTASALAHQVHPQYQSCEVRSAIATSRRAMTIATEDEYIDVQIIASTFLPPALQLTGHWEEADTLFRTNISRLSGHIELQRFGNPTIPAASTRAMYAMMLRWAGRFQDALELLEQAADIARRASHPYSDVFVFYGACAVLGLKGDFSQAIEKGERAVEICEACEGWLLYPWVSGALGSVYAQSGRTREGIDLMTDALRRFDEQGGLLGRIDLLPRLLDAHFLAGEIEIALAGAIEELNRLRKSQVIFLEQQVLELLGRIHSHPECYQPDKASQYFLAARRSAEKFGGRTTIAHTYAGLGRLNISMGKTPDAREELTRACEMYRDMDMTYYLHKAEEDLVGLG